MWIKLIWTPSKRDGDDVKHTRYDINRVRSQNRSLYKRCRPNPPEEHDDLILDQVDIPLLQTTGDAQVSAFRPSAMEKHIHDAVIHPSLPGKISQFVMESAQQGHWTKFLATPPVLQLAYDLSFGIRGLSVMRVRRFIQELEPQSSTTGINMTIFGRSNALQPASPLFSLRYIVDTFETLLLFGQCFYNNTVCDFIKANAECMARMSVLSQPDVATCDMLVHWLNSKLGKFHSEIFAANLQKRLVLDLSSPESMAI
ncbi:hypothetical protein PHMEG_00018502 [Phytophthora megakarya]|uniref:Uncharacterized protein n=1 Tax=Phytophthora megakarya TaxID=4795 RepID=A0A225VV75_9STRA|nr:hypothetical protein PHMEG_00018502 [Phytophthora megakarya]